MLVTSQSCLLWFGVKFCMSYDFSLTSQSCLLWFSVSFACHVISHLVSFSECRRTFSNLKSILLILRFGGARETRFNPLRHIV